jgi:hypothetical protein
LDLYESRKYSAVPRSITVDNMHRGHNVPF